MFGGLSEEHPDVRRPLLETIDFGYNPIITYHRKLLCYLSMGLNFGYKEPHVSAATRWDVSMIKSLTEK